MFRFRIRCVEHLIVRFGRVPLISVRLTPATAILGFCFVGDCALAIVFAL